MRAPARRKLALLLGGLSVVALALPANALAHGIVGRADLPIPVWLFSWTAAIVLVVSFVALSTMWTRPQLQEPRLRRLFVLPRAMEWLASLAGLGLFVLVVYSGFAGAQVTQANFSVTFIYVIFWVGLPVASVLFGDVFRVLNPWRTCATCTRRADTSAQAGTPGQPPAALPAVARPVARLGWDRRVRVARADLRRKRPTRRRWRRCRSATSWRCLPGWRCSAWRSGARRRTASASTSTCSQSSQRSCAARTAPSICAVRSAASPTYRSARARSRSSASRSARQRSTASATAASGVTTSRTCRACSTNSASTQTPAQELAYSLGLVFCILVICAVYRLGIVGRAQASAIATTPTC